MLFKRGKSELFRPKIQNKNECCGFLPVKYFKTKHSQYPTPRIHGENSKLCNYLCKLKIKRGYMLGLSKHYNTSNT